MDLVLRPYENLIFIWNPKYKIISSPFAVFLFQFLLLLLFHYAFVSFGFVAEGEKNIKQSTLNQTILLLGKAVVFSLLQISPACFSVLPHLGTEWKPWWQSIETEELNSSNGKVCRNPMNLSLVYYIIMHVSINLVMSGVERSTALGWLSEGNALLSKASKSI